MNIRKLAYQCATPANIGIQDSWRSEKSSERDLVLLIYEQALVIRKLEATIAYAK